MISYHTFFSRATPRAGGNPICSAEKKHFGQSEALFSSISHFLRHTEGIISTSSGMISSRPSSIVSVRTSLLKSERKPKLHVGPSAPKPGPTLLMAVSEAVKAAVNSTPSSDTTSVPKSKIAM